MYADWSSLVEEIKDEDSRSLDDALKAFPQAVGKGVVKIVLKALNDTQALSSSQKESGNEPTVTLTTHRQVEWTMSVISYGLSLPLAEQDLMHLCIDTYENWITVVYDPKPTVPAPVKEQPDLYVQAIFRQLCQVFEEHPETVPSANSSGNSSAIQVMLENQALLCNRVLRMLHMTVIQSASRLSRESWECLLMSLLRVANVVLAPPLEQNSLAVNLKSLPIHVLFVSWLQASVHAFPRPQLWKSLYELCHHWRHHACLANQWTRLVYTLTYKVISNLYTENYLSDIAPSPIRLDKNFQKIIDTMPYDVSIQCWYRILHTLGDPVELAYPMSIATLPAFKKFTQEREGGARYRSQQTPTQASLATLPRIYFELMRGVATLVYLFQGKDVSWVDWEGKEKKTVSMVRSSIRDLTKGGRQKQAAGGSSSNTNWYVPKTPSVSSAPSAKRDHHHSTTTDYENVFGEIRKPKGNTLLQLFGNWLFRAAIWPFEEVSVHPKGDTLFSSLTDLSAPKTMREPEDLLRYEKGRAEAFGALCSIFSSQDCGDPFQPIYLAKFYHALILGLHYTPETSQGHVLTEIIQHSAGLLRKDLMGINLVVPYFIDALDLILPRAVPPFKWVVDLHELRHASIDLLLSMICLPLHFLNQPLPNVFAVLPDLWRTVPATRHSFSSDRPEEPLLTEHEREPLTFLSLRDPLVQLLLNSIMHEGSPLNKQLLLHALNAIICDIVTYEDLLSKLVSEESPDHEVSSMFQDQLGGPRGSYTRSESHHSSEYSPSQLVGKAIVVCKTCLNHVEGDGSDTPVQVCLAALELLASIARLPPDTCNHTDVRYAVHMVSEFIEFQAMKDLPRHNRDLHTSIVAAFKTLMIFTLAHPYLMGSKESMSCVMRVIELGISGRFSMEQDGTVTYKGHKKDRPISGRVKEIAEFMLYLVMENVYAFPSPCGAEAASSLLSEEDVIARLPPEKRDQAKFQYFLLDNSVLVGLLEEPFTNSETNDDSSSSSSSCSSLPTVTAVVRGPSGRHVWSMQLRHHPRSHQPSSDHLRSAKRPNPKPHPPVPSAGVERKPWPDEVNRFPSLKLDFSLPTLDEVLDSSSQDLHDEIYQLTKKQVEEEMKLSRAFYQELEHTSFPDPRTAVEPPTIQEKFSTARLFLNHLSLLGMDAVKEVSTSRCQPLIRLDSTHPKFSKTLSALDSLPSRFCNTIFVLYCKDGVTKTEDILASNSSLTNKPGEFQEFLSSLGWLVDPNTHPGFAGKIHPPKLEGPSVSTASRPVGISAQIPQRHFPYFTDSVNELAFVVPKLRQAAGDSSASLRSAESSDSGQDLALVQNVSTLVASQQGRPHPISPMPHPLPPATPPGSRSSGQDSPSSLKPPVVTPTVSTTPTTPTSATNANTYMNIDSIIAPRPATSESTSTVNTTTEGYATYPGLSHQHQGKFRPSKGEIYPGGGGTGGETPRRKWHQQDCAAMIVWLERFEDHLTFPVGVLSKLLHSVPPSGAGSHKPLHGTTRKSLPVVFIHKMTSGLYQIVTRNTGGRPDNIAGPLIDGMVVSRRSLGTLARQTVINICSRHRMESEGFFPPHVKRKRKLEEMGHSYKQSLSVADFYMKLFTGKS